MAENTWQFEVMVDSAAALRSRYRRNPDVFVGGDLLMYYRAGEPHAAGRAGRLRHLRGAGP